MNQNMWSSLCMVVLACAAIASPADAARLSIRFADNDALLGSTIASPFAGPVLVEVLWEVTLEDIQHPPLTFVSLQLTSSPEDPNPGTQGDIVENPSLMMFDNSTDVPGWQALAQPGTAGGTGRFVAAALSPADGVIEPGITVIGTFRLDISNIDGLGDFYVARSPSAFTPQLDADFLTYSDNPIEDGYIPEYGIIGGFAGNDDGTEARPLTLVVPEPAALALLVVGAVLVGRRRAGE